MDIFTGKIEHFPGGTYYEQVRSPWGALELDTMRLAWRAWYLKTQLSLDKYDKDDMKFVAWVEKEERWKWKALVAQKWSENGSRNAS